MAESPEHSFLSSAALEVMEEASSSKLFSYKEGERKRFDFSCDLARDWSKLVSGQTLWKHTEGIDKDIRILLADPETSVSVYVARDAVKNRALFQEVVSDYRSSPVRDRLSRLRVFWVPGDFDADDEAARGLVYRLLRENFTNDLLLKVALGGIGASDVKSFATSRRPGYPLRILSHIGRNGHGSMTVTGKSLSISSAILKEEIQRLFLLGFIESEYLLGGIYRISEKGRVVLDICSRLNDYLNGGLSVNPSFEYICGLLGVNYASIDPSLGDKVGYRYFDIGNGKLKFELDFEDAAALILQHIYHAGLDASMDWPTVEYSVPAP
ncbi:MULTISPECIES: hypothetical protein [unclassified Streptomyces]|uniref:hypothetical protein n=1 Tax=unclassified Streptomyces TaxID=2593676 RepID=UPI00081F6B49|nr:MULTISPECIES: hypothetical protein [unclassified Streptomyces]MYR97881.1 hypothetical protein [Streptomyces sp. SID4937]SCE31143.1 hypothetical protein GA0115243_110278 [Streptomyces sp. ScaeMP-e83]